MDVSAYAAHMAALMGAHIIKVKLSTDKMEQGDAKKVYDKHPVDISTQAARVKHVVQSCFNGRRLVVFSGGAAKGADSVYDDARAIRDGGGNGSIRSEEHTSELQSLMRISYAVFCLKKKNKLQTQNITQIHR